MVLSRKYRWATLPVAALLLTGTGAAAWRPPAPAAQTAAPPGIEVATVTQQPVAAERTFSGRIEAVEQVDVRPLVSGTIVEIHFRDGDIVRKGQPLFTIDPRPYQAILDRARGELQGAQAAVDFAKADFDRADRLIGTSTISQRDYDQRRHAIRDMEARLAVARASVAAAAVDVEHTTIRAPVDGRISRAEVTAGNVVTAGANASPLSRVVSVSPVYAAFDADEQSYLAFIGRERDQVLPASLELAGEKTFSRSGQITSVDNRLDPATGTIRVRATFANADGSLVPGLYARVRISGVETKPFMLVDQRAIGVDQDKKFVLVVGSDGRVAYREIQLGDERDGKRLVLSGVAPGERLVIKGTQGIKPGDQVNVITTQAANAVQGGIQ
jgi:membrane fusion protein, multidrug efflux system